MQIRNPEINYTLNQMDVLNKSVKFNLIHLTQWGIFLILGIGYWNKGK